MAKPIGTLGTIDTITVGGRVFTDLANLIMLVANVNAGVAYSTMRAVTGSGGAGYAVTVGKTFKTWASRMFNNTTATSVNYAILYGDTDVGEASGAAPTTPIYMGGGTNYATIHNVYLDSGRELAFGSSFDIPAAKYPACRLSAAGQGAVHIFGYEV